MLKKIILAIFTFYSVGFNLIYAENLDVNDLLKSLWLQDSQQEQQMTNQQQVDLNKAIQLWIAKKIDNKPATLLEAIIMALRTKMLLDHKIWLVVWNYSNPIEAYLETAKLLFDVDVKDPNKPVTKDDLKIISKIIPINIQVEDNIIKKDELVKALLTTYETTIENKFKELEQQLENSENQVNQEQNQEQKEQGQQETEDELENAINQLTKQAQQETEQEENESTIINENNESNDQNIETKVSYKFLDPWTIEIDWINNADGYVLKNNDVEISYTAKCSNNKCILSLKEPVDTVDLYKNDNKLDTISIDKSKVYVKVKDEYKECILGYNTVADVYLPQDNNISVEFSGLFDYDDVGKFYIVDDNYNVIKERKIRSAEKYEFELPAGSYHILVENKSANNQLLNIRINDQSFKDYKLYNLSLGKVNINFNSESTPNKDISSNDKVYLVYDIQNVGDDPVNLFKMKLETEWTADVNDVKIWLWSNGTCNILTGYDTVIKGDEITIINNDISKRLKINIAETKSICFELSDFIGDENDYVKVKLDTTDETDVLFSIDDYTSKFASYTVSNVVDWYGKYTLKSTSVLFSNASNINVKIPVGTNVELFRWNAEIFGNNVTFKKWTVTINVSSGTNIDIDNVKLTYKTNDSTYNIDIDTEPKISWSTVTVTFDNDVELPKGQGQFILTGDIGDSMDGAQLTFNINQNDFEFENKDDDTIRPVSSVTSPNILVIKGDVDFSSTIKTKNVLVNTIDTLWSFTVQNFGIWKIKINSLTVNFTSPDNSDANQHISVMAIGYVDSNTDEIKVEDVNLITDYENVLGKTSYQFAINNPIEIDNWQSKTFVIVGKIENDSSLNNKLIQLVIPKNGAVFTTQYGDSIYNNHDLYLDVNKIKTNGDVTISITDNVDDTKIKSPADKYVVLGQLSIDPKYEDIRINKLVLTGEYEVIPGNSSIDYSKYNICGVNTVCNGLKDLEKIYIVKSDSSDACKFDSNFVDNIVGSGTVSDDPNITISMNEKVSRTDIGENTPKYYCIYWKLLTNETGLIPGTVRLKVKLADVSLNEIYGQSTWLKYSTTNISKVGEWRNVYIYPAILAFDFDDNVITTPGASKAIFTFTLANNNDLPAKIKEIKIHVNSVPEIILRNFRLVDAVTDKVVSKQYLLSNYNNASGDIIFKLNNYILSKYYSKQFKVLADVYTTAPSVDWTVNLTINVGDPNTVNSWYIKYVAIDTNNNEILYNNSNDVWFIEDESWKANNYEISINAINFDNQGLMASCNNLNYTITSAKFTKDENGHKLIITFDGDNVNDILNNIQEVISNEPSTNIDSYNIDYNNKQLVVRYVPADVFATDIPLTSTSSIEIHTISNDCYNNGHIDITRSGSTEDMNDEYVYSFEKNDSNMNLYVSDLDDSSNRLYFSGSYTITVTADLNGNNPYNGLNSNIIILDNWTKKLAIAFNKNIAWNVPITWCTEVNDGSNTYYVKDGKLYTDNSCWTLADGVQINIDGVNYNIKSGYIDVDGDNSTNENEDTLYGVVNINGNSYGVYKGLLTEAPNSNHDFGLSASYNTGIIHTNITSDEIVTNADKVKIYYYDAGSGNWIDVTKDNNELDIK